MTYARPKSASSRRVLIVDDNRDAANSLATLLRFHGHTVMVEYNGADAVDRFARDRPEIVLLDIGLPSMDGYEVCRRILEQESPVRVIAMTGYGQEQDRRRAMDAGFAAHMVKPVRPADILLVLAEPLPRDIGLATSAGDLP